MDEHHNVASGWQDLNSGSTIESEARHCTAFAAAGGNGQAKGSIEYSRICTLV